MRIAQTSLFFFSLTLIATSAVSCQQLWASMKQTAADRSQTDGNPAGIAKGQPPFDKLELFGMFAAGPIASYADQVIQKRGCDFTPDAAFVAAFPTPAFQAILKNIRPRAAKRSSPNRDAAYDLLRRALEATHHRQFAVSDENYQQALQLAPDSATLHLAYAANFLLVPDGARSEPEARKSLKLWPDNAEGHGILSMALMLDGKLPESIAEARETLRIYPEHKSAKFQLAASLTKNRQYDDAIPAIRNALVVFPDLPMLRKFLGIGLLRTKHTSEATEQLIWYVHADPGDAEGHYYLGLAYREAGRNQEAEAQFRLAPSLGPQ